MYSPSELQHQGDLVGILLSFLTFHTTTSCPSCAQFRLTSLREQFLPFTQPPAIGTQACLDNYACHELLTVTAVAQLAGTVYV